MKKSPWNLEAEEMVVTVVKADAVEGDFVIYLWDKLYGMT